MKRIDRTRLTPAQERRFLHLDDVINGRGCQDDGESEADYTRRREWQAQQNANADDAARYGVPAQYGR